MIRVALRPEPGDSPRMRKLSLALVLLAACGETAPPPAAPTPPPPAATTTPTEPAAKTETLTADSDRTTTRGNTFIAPAGWSITVRGPTTILEAPEAGSRIALVDVDAKDADAAVAAAWAAYAPEKKWPLKVVTDVADKDGWSRHKSYSYQTSPNEKRSVSADPLWSGEGWTVAIYDMADAVGEKRGAAVSLIFGRLLPKGYTRESFAGKKANKLDAARIAVLSAWTEEALRELKVPGVSIGIVQDGKTVFAGGFGVRELGKKDKPDANTLFMVASNTKALSTLLLAKLVDEKKLAWDTPVTQVLPSFKLGNEDTTKQVLVKHLVCACTGLPRQDLEWLFEFKGMTPASSLATLAKVQPTSKFGEMFQYSNLLAGAGGFVGGHVANPQLELGAAYDAAMKTRIFEPLEMRSTTFDYGRALASNHAFPHAPDIDGTAVKAVMEENYSVIPLRPAGGAWSNVHDMLQYVSMELADGKLANGKPFLSRDALFERRKPQVSIGKDSTYGMGLIVNTKYASPVVHHGGDLIGFHSDMMWLPEHGVGAVVLTNGDPGFILRDLFRRKLLEVLFDGRPEADALLASQAKSFYEHIAAERKLLTVPATNTDLLGKRYRNDALGTIAVTTAPKTTFDFGEWKSDIASKKNPDGTTSFVTTVPGLAGFEFTAGSNDANKKTLTLRDAQHEYVFVEE